MKLAFYKVDNSMNYERHTFDNLYDKPDEIIGMLEKLTADEWRTYDMNRADAQRWPDAQDFEEDYNDELLDGGWWCVVLRK